MAKQTVSPDTLTGVSLAVAVVFKAVASLSRANGAVWRALQEAAGAFPVTMSDADKSALSGELARTYRKHGGLDNAAVLASQHARAIHLIATRKPANDGTVPDPAKFSNMSAFFGVYAQSKGATTKGHAGTAGASQGATVPPANPASATQHRADAGNAPDTGAPVANADSASIGTLVTQNMLSAHGLPADIVQVFQDLLTLARANPQLQDALTMARNNPDRLLTAAVSWVEAERAQVSASMGNPVPAVPATAMAAALADAVAKTARKGGKLEAIAA